MLNDLRSERPLSTNHPERYWRPISRAWPRPGPVTRRIIDRPIHVTTCWLSVTGCDEQLGLSPGGRGLLLVEALAGTWGWYPEGPGKVVWFEFPEQHEAPCPTHGWGTALGLAAA